MSPLLALVNREGPSRPAGSRSTPGRTSRSLQTARSPEPRPEEVLSAARGARRGLEARKRRRPSAPRRGLTAVIQKTRRRPTLPRGFPRSTIGSGGLNFRVRDGNGCDPSDIATGKASLHTKGRNSTSAERCAVSISVQELEAPDLDLDLESLTPHGSNSRGAYKKQR